MSPDHLQESTLHSGETPRCSGMHEPARLVIWTQVRAGLQPLSGLEIAGFYPLVEGGNPEGVPVGCSDLPCRKSCGALGLKR